MSGTTIERNNYPNTELIKALLSTWIRDDDFTYQYFLRGLQNKNDIYIYEASKDTEMAGFITGWKSEFHPYCTYFAMITKPHSGFEIETGLIEALCNDKKFELPLQTSIWETSYRLKSFYENAGFLEVRRTYLPVLRTEKIDIQQDFPDFNDQELCIIDLNSLSNQEELKYKLIKLVKENYESIHTVNPVGVHSYEKWESLIFNEDTIQSGSYIMLKENEILAYSFLHYSDTPHQFEFGWRGTKENTDIRLMLMLTACQINYALENGVKYIQAEIDNTDLFSLEMLKYFPFSPAPSLLTYQRIS